MKIIKEAKNGDIDNPDVIEIGIKYDDEKTGAYIKVTEVSIDCANMNKPGFIIDYEWQSPTGKKGKTKNASIEELLQYFKD